MDIKATRKSVRSRGGTITRQAAPLEIDKLQEAAGYLIELMGSYEADKLCNACRKLAESIKGADSNCLQFLHDKDVVGTIVKMMEDLPSHSTAQQVGCQALLSCNRQVELRTSIERHKAYQVILAAMKAHTHDPYLQGTAVHALASLAETAIDNSGLKESKAYKAVFTALKNHRLDINTQSGGLLALANLLRDDCFAAVNAIHSQDHLEIFTALTTHSSRANVVAHGLRALQTLASEEQCARVLIEQTGVLQLALSLLKTFPEHVVVVTAFCSLIEALTFLEAVSTEEAQRSKRESVVALPDPHLSLLPDPETSSVLLQQLTDLLASFPEVLEIQVNIFSAIEHICALETVEISDSLVEQWMHCLETAFVTHGRELWFQEAGCRCLARLLHINPHLHSIIGDDSTKYQIPLHNHVWFSLLGQLSYANGPQPTVFSAVAQAVYYLVESDESLQELLLSKGATQATLETVREFLHEATHNERCVELGCRALRGMLTHPSDAAGRLCPESCRHSECHYVRACLGQCHYLVEIGIVQDLIKILDDFCYDPEVITEAFCVVACLADIDDFQEAVVLHSLHKRVLKAVERHAGHTALVEGALETLIHLAQNPVMVQLLNEADCLGTAISIMRKHVVSSSIQCRGCILIRIVCHTHYLQSKPVCSSVAKVVIDALFRKTDRHVQIEALVCAKRLSECSQEMAGALVKGDIHLILFSLLYREEEEGRGDGGRAVTSPERSPESVDGTDQEETAFVFRVGSDVIYILSCIHDFKQEMLNSAIKDGLLEAVKVLVEIGADVNSGEEQDSPLCIAVASRSLEMVEFLLEQGAHSHHRALTIARELKQDTIIGLLLEYIGVTHNGDFVNLSGLDLEMLKPTWILPSLGVRGILSTLPSSSLATVGSSPSKRYPPREIHHKKKHSLGHIKDFLIHRKSIGNTEGVEHQKALQELRKKFKFTSSDGDESEENSGLVGKKEDGRGGEVEPRNATGGVDEPDSGISNTVSCGASGSHKKSPEMEWKDPDKKLSLSLLSSAIFTKVGSGSPTIVRSNRSSTDSIQDSTAVWKMSGGLDPALLVETAFSDPISPSRLQEKLDSLPPLPPVTTPTERRRKVAVVDVLTPIMGTPEHAAETPSPRKGSSDSGVDNADTLLAQPASPRGSIQSADGVLSPGRRVPPRRWNAPQRDRTSSVSGVGAAKKTLPLSTTENYAQEMSAVNTSSGDCNNGDASADITMNPSLLYKQLTNWRKGKERRRRFSSTSELSHSNSPIPVVYSRTDYYYSSSSSSMESEASLHHDITMARSPRSGAWNLPLSLARGATAGGGGGGGGVEEGAASDSELSDMSFGGGGYGSGNKGILRGLGIPLKELSPGPLETPLPSSAEASRKSSAVFSEIPNVPLSAFAAAKKPRDEVDFGGACETILEDKPTILANPHLVKVLDLSSNRLSGWEELADSREVFWRLRDVHRLDLKQNQLSDLLQDMMEEMKKLKVFNLSYNSFTVFPTVAITSQALTELDLSSNKISRVPTLPVLPNLARLNLSKNQLDTFPLSLSGESLPRLTTLDLRSNVMTTIPRCNTGLRELEVLNISKNQIKKLPDQFLASLPSIKTLDASWNELEEIAGEVSQDYVQLQVFKVAHNNLIKAEIDFINFITSAPTLQIVDGSDNGLHRLPPPYAWKSRGVREIRMSGNKITKLDLSDCGRYWPNLESFYLGQNKLKEIPKEIGDLRTLSCLDISHNKEIRHLPTEMGNLEYLFMLNLQGLKHLSLDPSLQNGPTKNIVAYLKSRHTKSVPYYHMKMMIVGAADKGKTTLLQQLLQDRPSPPSKGTLATLGVSVKRWTYQQKQPQGSVVPYHVSCWDFAGQEEFYSTHQCFLSQRSLYVLVYNLSKGESELQSVIPWLLNIQARAPSSPVIIVGTHTDKIPQAEFEKRRHSMRDKIRETVLRPGFPSEITFAEVSCFDQQGVAMLRKKIKILIDSAKLHGQKIMGGMVPQNYLLLEELIQKERRKQEKSKSRFPILRISRLRQLMEESKLSLKMGQAELDQAISFLHECGVLLHYSGDLQTSLSQLLFLNPEWLCMLMAHVITIPEMNSFISSEGLMNENTIPHLLKEPKFPSDFIPEYIRLLERFEVALRHDTDTLLIPSRLPRRKPSNLHLPPASPGSLIVRRYSVCYIPPGFWARLIVRLTTFPKRALPSSHAAQSVSQHMWLSGVYTYWSEQAFFLVELQSDNRIFDITVPTTNIGTKLLCSIVDNVEALIDEWFPGLRDFDVVHGDELVKPLSLCPLCPTTSPPHCFKLKDLQLVALTADEIECPKHRGNVLLEQLAPDIVIGDLDPKYKALPEEFMFNEKSTNVIGKGGFGEVYKATFRGQTVAVKVFSQNTAAINNTTPNHLIRQEVSILSQLDHPHIISMVGVCLRPKAMLLMEFAELGSLNSFYPYSNISLPLKHRIALQVASALAFLHKNKIIYRDLKADNVLIFSLSLIYKVNAKLSDYGIACFATESGLTQPIGTVGCKAPELLKANASAIPYNEQVDVYSLGLMLFVLMTNGHRPFEELGAGYEVDKAIAEGRPINDIEYYGCPPWPDMQDLINHCLQYVPSQRPSAQEVFDRLCSTEFVCLKRAVPVGHNSTLETFTTRFCMDKRGTKNVEVWMVSSLGQQSVLSVMNLSKKNASPQGMLLPPNELVLSIVAVETSLVVMGTNRGKLFVYSGYDSKKHQLAPLEQPVLCLLHYKSPTDGASYVCAGLGDGTLAFYDQYMLTIPNAHPRLLKVGQGEVRSMRRHRNRLFVVCGREVVVVRFSSYTVERRWTAVEDRHGYLTGVEVGQELVWTSQAASPKVQVWDLEDGAHRGTLHCKNILHSLLPKGAAPVDAEGASVTSMLLQPAPYSTLWLGLQSGHMLLINAASQTALLATKRHVSAIKCIHSVKALVSDKPVHLILTGGFGFQQRPGYPTYSKGTPESYGNLLVWDSILPKLKSTYDAIKKRLEPFR